MHRFTLPTILLAATLFAAPAWADKKHDHHGPDGSTSYSNTTKYDFPANAAARTRAGNCEQGVAGNFAGIGAAVATGNPVCDFLAIADSMGAAGDEIGQKRNLRRADRVAFFRACLAVFRGVITLGLL